MAGRPDLAGFAQEGLKDADALAFKAGDIVQVREKSRKQLRIQAAMTVAQQVGLPDWVELNDKEFRGVFKTAPARDDVLPDINENLVVELYSK